MAERRAEDARLWARWAKTDPKTRLETEAGLAPKERAELHLGDIVGIAGSDILVPKEKEQFLADANEKVRKINNQYWKGWITADERYQHAIRIWSKVKGDIASAMIKHFVENVGKVVSRNELLDKVWGYDVFPTTRTVDNHIVKLRKQIEDDPANPTVAVYTTIEGTTSSASVEFPDGRRRENGIMSPAVTSSFRADPRFLPMTRAEMQARGWEEVDIVFVTGDAYIDHSSFAMAILGRVLEAAGYRVAVLSQPDWRSAEPWRTFGRPRLFFAISAGNMDSMINHYTANKKVRNDDAYSPGGKIGLRRERPEPAQRREVVAVGIRETHSHRRRLAVAAAGRCHQAIERPDAHHGRDEHRHGDRDRLGT